MYIYAEIFLKMHKISHLAGGALGRDYLSSLSKITDGGGM